ncbi:membrane protein [Streptomyces hygroscopicus]|uniref:PP2C family protein-serine/threonine phosphatase n=1 Tax=Streptomyces hygroscopicus TaxID=1912 RepID=UPI00223FE40D|nr:PP2C family protein-serine/threonine phosphatase [Streptomyces hygroscopicus]MCW7944369.1 membrane protein [Streptomyces hygroscopicus]
MIRPLSGIRKRQTARRGPSRFASWAPVVTLVLAVALDVSTDYHFSPRNLQFYRLLSVAPALAASVWSVPATVAIGIVACCVELLLAWTSGEFGSPVRVFTIAVIASVTGAAAYASHARQERERTLSQVRTVAETAQQMVLRPMPQHLGPLDLGVLYVAAAAEARIGGDFYEALLTPHGVRLIVGDVRGKGLSAVGVASAALGAFREAAYDAPDLAQVAARLELALTRYSELIPGEESEERFATAVLVEVPSDLRSVRLVNCGHPPPILLHRGEVQVIDATAPSPPLALGGLIGNGYLIDAVPFQKGDLLLLYTDGVSETRDKAGTFYPLSRRLRQWPTADPGALLTRLRQDLVAYSGGHLDDDVAAVAVSYR